MAYDGFYAGLSSRASINEILNLAMKTKDEAERIAIEIKESEANAKLSALEAALQADRAKMIADGLAAEGGGAGLQSVAVYSARDFGFIGGADREESKSLNRALTECGLRGGGVVVVKSLADGDPIFLDKPVQIEHSNVTLLVLSPIIFAHGGFLRISGGYEEIRRTELGQVDLIAISVDTFKDPETQNLAFTTRPGEGQYLRVGDRVTLRGENDAVGNAIEKQTVTIAKIDGDTVVSTDEPENGIIFRAKYPESAWIPDHTTGTTVSIVVYSAFTEDKTGPNVFYGDVDDGSKFKRGDLLYVSDARLERDVMFPEPATLKSAAVMEHAKVSSVEGNRVFFDRVLLREYLKSYKGGVSKLRAIFNSHIITNDISWKTPQESRKSPAVSINFGDKCSVQVASMRGEMGRLGTGIRVAYSYDCTVANSQIFNAARYESAEGYGIVLYYSTYSRITKCVATGNRHNYLVQTTTSCDIIENVSTDDYISGIDLHGAGAINTRILNNRVTRSNKHTPDSTKGGGIRNGNTSHMIGDHGTLIANNYIEGYNDTLEAAAIDVSPSSQNVVVRDNHVMDCSIGFRHYKVHTRATVDQIARNILVMGNTFQRCTKLIVTDKDPHSWFEDLTLIDNISMDNASHFRVQDVPKVTMIGNKIINPRNTAGSWGFDVKNCQDLYATDNLAKDANKGFRVENCPNGKVVKNLLDFTRDNEPFRANGANPGLINKANTLEDSFASPTITVGTVTTGAAGTSATVVNRGTSTNVILDFVIPRG